MIVWWSAWMAIVAHLILPIEFLPPSFDFSPSLPSLLSFSTSYESFVVSGMYHPLPFRGGESVHFCGISVFFGKYLLWKFSEFVAQQTNLCIYKRSAYGNTSYNVHTNSLHYLHRQSTPKGRRSFLRMRIICSISWNHEWGGAEKFESTLVLHFWWYQRQTRLIDQLWLIFEKRGTR